MTIQGNQTKLVKTNTQHIIKYTTANKKRRTSKCRRSFAIVADVEVDIALDKAIGNKLDDFSIGRLRYCHIRHDVLQSSIIGSSIETKLDACGRMHVLTCTSAVVPVMGPSYLLSRQDCRNNVDATEINKTTYVE